MQYNSGISDFDFYTTLARDHGERRKQVKSERPVKDWISENRLLVMLLIRPVHAVMSY